MFESVTKQKLLKKSAAHVHLDISQKSKTTRSNRVETDEVTLDGAAEHSEVFLNCCCNSTKLFFPNWSGERARQPGKALKVAKTKSERRR